MSAPILVTGADRSGTTLLYTLLASHPRIMMVRRTNLWRWFDGKFGDLSDPDNLDRCLHMIMRYERLSVLAPDRACIVRDFENGEPTYGRLFEVLFSQHAARLGFSRWGDKSLHTELVADRVFSEWPDARIVQVVRDPRDRYASVVGRTAAGSRRNASIVARWIRSTRAAARNADRFSDQYMVLRYEDLTTRPVEMTKRVCEFVGEEFQPEMMEMRGGDRRSMDGGNSSFEALPPGVISTGPIGRHKSQLSARSVAFIEVTCRKGMRAYGYEADSPHLDLGDRLGHIGDLIEGVARIPAWLLRENYAERRDRTVPDQRLIDSDLMEA